VSETIIEQGAAKPVPVPDEGSLPYFEGARRGELLVQHCTRCAAYVGQPVYGTVPTRCTRCLHDSLEWVAASGRATLYSFGIMHTAFHPGFAGELPYTTNVVGCANADLRIGMALEVVFEAVSDEVTLPKFTPM
jgi:uncharacterized OB-fold protein